jgi:hypothetical protein
MRVYWDQIRVGMPAAVSLTPEHVPLAVARLSKRGFSAEIKVGGREPATYDYALASWSQPWKVAPGRYTRTGDVLELLAQWDDLFVVSKPGDDLALSFVAKGLVPVPAGAARTFLFFGAGFSKEMDINSASPDVVLPYPYRGMTQYPYPEGEAPAMVRERQAAKADAWDTRLVGRSLPAPELAE